jgi:dTDP-4-amino-4,6-dideoxygalactose transaminase
VLRKTPNIKAIVPVHLYGCCADMEAFLELGRRHGVPVLEDAAQALGAQHSLGGAGAIGEAGWFSFYPTKNLGAFGDAGMVVCRDAELATKLRALRNHGMEVRYYHKWIGGNFRIDAIQSAVLSVKLPHLDAWSAGRRERAAWYREQLRSLPLILPVEPWRETGLENHHIYNQFIVRTERREALRAHLTAAGVATEIYYPLCLHMQECFRDLGYQEGDFPEAEKAARETLALPIYPELRQEQQAYVAEKVTEFFA